MRLLHFFMDGIRSCFTFKTLEISIPTSYRLFDMGRKQALQRGHKYKKKLTTSYLECGSMERLMKFHNIWGFCSMLDFPFWQRLCLCVLEIQWILHTSARLLSQPLGSRFTVSVSLCSRVRKGDNLAIMAHFRSPLLFSHTPSPHTG